MRTYWTRWALSLACLALFACGSETNGGDGGTGGVDIADGGTGGPGGSGGAGGGGGGDGAGGAGGGDEPGPTCGNGILDPGEECDDGNTRSNDGCSSECRIEGTCEVPFNFRPMATLDRVSGLRLAEWTFAGARSDEFNSCGTRGAEGAQKSVVFSYKNGPHAGVLYLAGAAPEDRPGITVAARTSCGEASSELICMPADLTARPTYFLEPEEEVFFIAEAPALYVDGGVPFAVGTFFEGFLGEGEACEPEPGENDMLCLEGLVCAASGSTYTCQPDAAPTLEAVRAHRDGDRLVLILEGTDEPGNVDRIEAIFLDDQDRELHYPGYIEGTSAVAPVRSVEGRRTFKAEWDNPEFFQVAGVAATHSVRLALLDKGDNRSNEMTTTVVDLPLVGEGESCDQSRRENVCIEGLTCRVGTCRE